MRKIGELVESVRTNAERSTTNSRTVPDAISTKWIDALFAKFGRVWPVMWIEICRVVDIDDMTHEWSEGLAGLSGEQVAVGLKRAIRESKWPPSIAEFRQFARDGWEHRSAAYRELRPEFLLPNGTAEAREIAAKQAFSEIRNMLGGEK